MAASRGLQNGKTIRSILRAVREFRADFDEVTVGDVNVRFSQRAPEAAKKKAEPTRASVSAIRSLQMTPPVFEGPLEGDVS